MLLLGRKITRTKKPHYYQSDCLAAVERDWAEGIERCLLCLPTGAGKSFISGELCARIIEKGGRALFLVHTRDLVHQFAQGFERDFGCSTTIEMGGTDTDDSPMVVGTIQSMVNRVKSGKWGKDAFGIIIIDEGHRVHSSGYRFVIEHFSGHAKIVAVTASPRRGDKKDLLEVLQVMSYDLSLKELIEGGYLSPIIIKHEPLGIEVSNIADGAEADAELGLAIEPFLEEAARRVLKHSDGRAGLSFLPLRKTARKFADILNRMGLKTEYIGGDIDSEERSAILNRLQLGKTKHVTNAQLLQEGIDVRCASLLADLRPTSSWTSAVQKWGRLTRTFDPSADYAPKGTIWPKKENAILIDFCFETEKHSLLQRPAVLVAKDEEEAEIMEAILKKGGGGDLMEAVKSASDEKEAKLRSKLEAMAKRKARTINAMEFFSRLHMPDFAEYEANNEWEARPIRFLSEKQRDWLVRSKFDMDSIKNMGQAKKILDALGNRAKEKKATIGQIKYGISLGFDEDKAWDASFDEMSRFIEANKPEQPWAKWKTKR